MQIILETPEGSRASHFVSPSAQAFLPPGSSLVTSSLYLATRRSSSSPYLTRLRALAFLLISYSLHARFNRLHESPTSRPKRVNPFTLMRAGMREKSALRTKLVAEVSRSYQPLPGATVAWHWKTLVSFLHLGKMRKSCDNVYRTGGCELAHLSFPIIMRCSNAHNAVRLQNCADNADLFPCRAA